MFRHSLYQNICLPHYESCISKKLVAFKLKDAFKKSLKILNACLWEYQLKNLFTSHSFPSGKKSDLAISDLSHNIARFSWSIARRLFPIKQKCIFKLGNLNESA